MPRKLSKNRNSLSANPSPRLSTSSPSTPSADLAPWAHDSLPLPRLIVLDLDYTLWPFYSDIHIAPPLKPLPSSNHLKVADRNGEQFGLFKEAPAILSFLSSQGTRLAVASKSPVDDLCREVLKMLRLPGGEGKGRKTIDVFDGGLEIYEGTKLHHFKTIMGRTGVPYEEMLFLDDEPPNYEVESLGVTMRLVGNKGLCWAELEKGIQKWRANRGF